MGDLEDDLKDLLAALHREQPPPPAFKGTSDVLAGVAHSSQSDAPTLESATAAAKDVPVVESNRPGLSLSAVLSALDAAPSPCSEAPMAGSQQVGDGDLLASMRGVLAALSKEGKATTDV